MKRLRSVRKYVESSESENEPLSGHLKKKSFLNEAPSSPKHDTESSSESDIENYLLKPEKLNLDSQFFNTNASEFEKVENDIFSGITKLSDSESDTDKEKDETDHTKPQKEKDHTKPQKEKDHTKPQKEKTKSTKMNFKQLQEYTKQIEEAKRHIEIYKAKKEATDNQTDIFNLLATGERNLGMEHNLKPEDLHSSDFESCESEKEDWEEIETKTVQENQVTNLLPKSSLQITVDMPTNVKKKKGVDLLAAMKRRLNRIRKENQVLVHKVHLLCWIAHGNYVNSSINDAETLARALSLLPSEQCYPSDRIDLSYLEQIVNWYKRTVKMVEKPVPEFISFDKSLQSQISQKEAYNKKMLICIFIAVLRALGVQTRIVMSLQPEPLRPPSSELHTVSTKSNEKNKDNQTAVKSKSSKKNTTTEVKTQVPNDRATSTHAKESKNNKESRNMNNNLKLKIDKAMKSKPVKNPTTEKNSNGVKVEPKATSSKNHKSTKVNAGKSEKTKNEDKLSKGKTEGKTDRRNTTHTKNSEIESKDNLKTETGKKSKEIKSNKTDGKDAELPLQKNIKTKKKESSETSDKSKSKVSSKPNLESLKATDSKGSIKGTRSKGRSVSTNQAPEKTSQNNLEPKDSSQKTKARPKSVETKSTGRSKSLEDDNKKGLRTRTRKRILQVDGLDDSDSDVEMMPLQLDGANDEKKQPKSSIKKKSSSSHSVNAKSSKKAKQSDSESEFEPSPEKRKRVSSTLEKCNLKKLMEKKSPSSVKQLDVRNDIVDLIKGRISEQKQVDRTRLAKAKGKSNIIESDSDSDYVAETIKKKFHDSDDDFVAKTKVKRRIQPRSVLSDCENEPEKNKKKGNDVWLEVFLEAEEKWISVDVIYGQVHCVKEISQRASHPVSYVVAWDNNNKLKDVTQRYCQNFNTVTRKQRVDAKWWNDSLKPFMGIPTARDKEEDDDLARQQLDQPLPKAISEYKNHPLYALNRHLLKFQAIYPPDPPTLGFIRGEAVYSRSCVFTLHSRDIWLKQAKVVKLGEKPYKIVKARPKYDRLSNKTITGQLLEIFGPWQVQDYEPPTAENGIVPKNAFGNVDLFKPCMLPKGCVHLKLPGLNRIARKMNVDIASAIVGFDFHGGWSHPVYDGFVACKEFEDQLISVWELEQDELERKEEEKIEKRVYGNWRKLIKGLLIRERLKAKYDFGEPSTSNAKDNKTKAKRSTK